MFRKINRSYFLVFAIWIALQFCCNDVIGQSLSVQDQKDRIEGLLVEGRQNMDDGHLESAFNNFVFAKKYAQANGFNEMVFTASIELGNFYMLKGEPEEAEEIFLNIELNENFAAETVCRYYHRMAFFYNQLGDEDSALVYSFKALNYAEENNFTEAKGVIFNELGNLYEKDFDFDSSIYYYDLARQVFDNNSYDYANASYNFGRIHFRLENYDTVIFHLEQLAARIEDKEWYFIQSPCYNYLAYSYTFLGDSLTGYKYRELSLRAELEVRNQNHNENLENLKISYETDKKNQEIEKHKSDLSKEKAKKEQLFVLISFLVIFLLLLVVFYFIIRKKNSRLNKLVKENEFLVGEANHRIKNNLQIIVSLVSREIYKNQGQEITALQSIQSKIESIATLHQQLYVNEEKSQIDLSEYLKTLNENLAPLCELKNIELKLNVDDLVLYNVSKAIYIGLLYNELVINSIKHAFENPLQSAKIEVEVMMKNEKIQLNYRDNGRGTVGEIKPKLIDMMCRQLKGKYKIESQNGFVFKTEI